MKMPFNKMGYLRFNQQMMMVGWHLATEHEIK